MESSRQHVTLDGDVFTNIYDETSIPVGTKISIQNLSSSAIFIYVGATPGSSKGEVLLPFDFYIVAAGTLGCFVKTTSDYPGLIAVQTGAYSQVGSPIDERVYTGLKGLTIQSFTEANSKNGTEFELSYHNASVAAGANYDLLFTTGSKPVLIKNRQVIFTGAEVQTQVYKGTTVTPATGTATSIFNHNTRLLYPSLCTAIVSPTVTGLGTAVSAAAVTYGTADQGNRTHGTYSVGGSERVLQTNTAYLLRVTNTSASACKVSVYISFYEGELSSEN